MTIWGQSSADDDKKQNRLNEDSNYFFLSQFT
jgi:hypothetical protein